MYVILTVMMIVLYIKQREKQSIHDKLILEQKIQEAQAELKGKARELEQQQEELRRRDEEEKDIRYFTEGIARFSDIIAKKRQNLEELSTGIISELVRYVDASAGGIFILDDSDPDHMLLKATGEFCFSSDDERKPVFEAGEGTIGTCFLEKKIMVLEDAPDNYIKMRSGLGEISLHHVIYIPVLQDNICVGVIEIASIHKLPQNKVMFCEKIAESLASIVAIIKANDKTREMLERNNAQAEELRAQEEEMRQNLEELQATQEMSLRKEKELIAELADKTKQIELLQEKMAKSKK
jgi:hypothetical protein